MVKSNVCFNVEYIVFKVFVSIKIFFSLLMKKKKNSYGYR